MTVQTYLHEGRKWAARLAGSRRIRSAGQVAALGLGPMLLSGAGLGGWAQCFSMGLISTATGWRAGVMALGSIAGYRLFWGDAGIQGMVWAILAGMTAMVLGKSRLSKEQPLLIPALCGFWTAASGLVFLILGENTPTPVYLLRVLLAGGSSRLFLQARRRREPVELWLIQGIGALALARFPPVGYLVLGAAAAAAPFPAAVLAGVALDLGGAGPGMLSAVACLAWMTRMIPGQKRWHRLAAPGAVCLCLMSITGQWSPALGLGVLAGGFLSCLAPERPPVSHRRGDTGMAQVRLEVAAGVLSQSRQALLEVEEPSIDREALMERTRERACGACPNRKNCAFLGKLPPELLYRPLTENNSLPLPCRKPGRMILELRRTQEQYRLLRADRERRREYRLAVMQQYDFLSDYLHSLADALPRRGKGPKLRFRVEVGMASGSREPENGDRFLHFSGSGGKYFLLLCDGMGTGPGAAGEAESAGAMLRRLLTAGFPAEHALRSLNSQQALRGRAGAVTVDLAEISLETGAAALYKWGAAPSYRLRQGRIEKIGTAGPPPGIDLAMGRETVERLSLRGGDGLILLSDGVDGEEVRRCAVAAPGGSAGELAERLLEIGAAETSDDATVAVARLHPEDLLT